MFYFRKRIVEVVQQTLPPPVLGRLPETHGVALKISPPYEKQVLGWGLNTTPKFVAPVAWHGRDNGLGLGERLFKLGGLAGADIKNGYFENHNCAPAILAEADDGWR